MPQDIAIYEDMTAFENVSFFASLYGLSGNELKSQSLEALEFVGLEDQCSRYAKTYSGGMKRRLNIACALAHKPKLLIMDEPTVGVDPQSRNNILECIRTLNKQGMTIIYTSHYMEEIEALCTRVGIIDHGKLIAEGTPSELQSIVTDRNTISIDLKYDDPISQGLFEGLKHIKGVINVSNYDNKIDVDTLKEADLLSLILTEVIGDGRTITQVKTDGVNLETAFLSMTGRRLRD